MILYVHFFFEDPVVMECMDRFDSQNAMITIRDHGFIGNRLFQYIYVGY